MAIQVGPNQWLGANGQILGANPDAKTGTDIVKPQTLLSEYDYQRQKLQGQLNEYKTNPTQVMPSYASGGVPTSVRIAQLTADLNKLDSGPHSGALGYTTSDGRFQTVDASKVNPSNFIGGTMGDGKYRLNSDGTFQRTESQPIGQGQGGQPLGYSYWGNGSKLWSLDDKTNPLSSLFSKDNFLNVANARGDQGYQMNVGSLTPEQKKALGIEGVDNGYGIKFTDFTAPGWGMEVKQKAKGGVGIGGLLQTGLEHIKTMAEGVWENPLRLITGIDPLSTKLWNSILNKDDKPLMTLFGGPTEDTFQKTGASDLTRNFFKVADTVAGVIGGGMASSALGGALGASGGTGSGILGSSISTGSQLGNAAIGGALKGAATGALTGAANAAASGGNVWEGVRKGATTGAISGGVGGGVSTLSPTVANALSGALGKDAAGIITKLGSGALTGAISNALQGKDAMGGAINGAIGSGSSIAGNALGGALGNKDLGGIISKLLSSGAGYAINKATNKGASLPQQEAIGQAFDKWAAKSGRTFTAAQRAAAIQKAMKGKRG